MFCKKCGKEIPDNSVYCPYCGELVVDKEEVNNEAGIDEEVVKITFKQSIINLFSRIFIFEGKTAQREFNLGLLFLMIVSFGLSMIMSMPEANKMANELLSSNGFDENMFNEYIASFISKDIFHFTNLYNIAVALVYSVFLVAPVYRRMIDSGKSVKFASLFAILYVVSELVCCNLLYCLLPDEIYFNISGIIELFSIVNLVIILMCIFSRSQPTEN